jgi:uncharacterized protein YciW
MKENCHLPYACTSITDLFAAMKVKKEPQMSELELQRMANIKRNAAFVSSLGITPMLAPSEASSAATAPKPRRKRKLAVKSEATADGDETAAPPRRSRRLTADAPEFAALHAAQAAAAVKKERVYSMRQLPLELDDEGEKVEGTASRAHCLHRVRTMTDAALATRVKVIEKARGRHCVRKLAVFAAVLRDEGKLELAAAADEALARLTGAAEP